MGSIEDDEPPSKRVKSSSQESTSHTENSFFAEPASLLGDAMAQPLPSQGDEEMVGSQGVIKRVEFVRIITKELYSLGYERSGALLEEESGIPLHSSMVSLFRKQVLDGDWDESLATLRKIGLSDENVKSASFLILEHKFFEFLDEDRVMDALKTLRSEISTLGINKKRVHKLTEFIVSPKQYELFRFTICDIASANSQMGLLEKLQYLLPPAVMIPERRLEHLVEQALNVQRDACLFHNSLDSALSLYSDHQCGKDQIASQTLQHAIRERDSQQPKVSQSSMTKNDIFSQVMGEDKHGRVRMMGMGVSPSTLWGTEPSCDDYMAQIAEAHQVATEARQVAIEARQVAAEAVQRTMQLEASFNALLQYIDQQLGSPVDMDNILRGTQAPPDDTPPAHDGSSAPPA